MNTKKWATATGEKVRIKDMEDSHLLNCIRLLDRIYNSELSAAYSCSAMFSGEMATYYVERDISRLEEEGPSMMFPIYDDLIAEAERRTLKL